MRHSPGNIAVWMAPLSRRARIVGLLAAFGGLLFDGFELGLMPIDSMSSTKGLLGGSVGLQSGPHWANTFVAAIRLAPRVPRRAWGPGLCPGGSP